MIVEESGDLDLVLVQVGEPQLKGAEETRQAWYHWSHEPEFSQHTLPLLDANSVSPSQILEYVQDPLQAALCELQRLPLSVQYPS